MEKELSSNKENEIINSYENDRQESFDEYLGNEIETDLETGYLSGKKTKETNEDSRPRSISPLIRQNSGTESTPKSPIKMFENETEDLCQTCHSRN